MRTPSETLKDRWLDAALKRLGEGGWTAAMIEQSAQDAGLTEGEKALAAPNGINDLIDHFFDTSADDMLVALATTDLDALRVHEKVAAGLKAWLGVLEPNRDAVHGAAMRGMLPWHAGRAGRRIWAVADAIWEAAGDTATDYNRQTKRALLSAVIPSVLMRWLQAPDEAALDRHIAKRLKQAMQLGKTGGKFLKPVLDVINRK